MGSTTFWKVQYAKETVKGTAVAATKRWYGTASIPKDRELVHPEYTLGIRAASASTEIRQLLADPVTLQVDNGYYQALPALLGTLLKGGVTATEQTSGKGDYLFDFTPSLTAAGAPDTLCLQVGDNDQAYGINYLMGKKFTISSAVGNNSDAKISQEFFGQQVTKLAFTASISAPAVVEPIMDNTLQMWMDPTWANIGTTVQSNLLRDVTAEIGTGNHPKFLANGLKTFATYGEGDIYGALKFTFEGGAGAVAIFDAYQAGTAEAIQLKWTGGIISAGSLAYSLTLQFYGTFDEVIPLSGDKDGNTLYGAVFSTISDGQATPHVVGAKVSVNQNAY
jgi:hypothetical protein